MSLQIKLRRGKKSFRELLQALKANSHPATDWSLRYKTKDPSSGGAVSFAFEEAIYIDSDSHENI